MGGDVEGVRWLFWPFEDFFLGSEDKPTTIEPSTPGPQSISQGLRVNTRSTSELLPVVYGQIRLGGNLVFIEPAGANNDDLWIVQNLAEGECDSIAQVDSVDQVFLAEKIYTDYGGNVSYTFYGGSSSQTADAALTAAIEKWDDNQHYTCYVVYKLSFDKDYFQNMPELVLLLKGLKLFDFRDSSTAWSDNPVLALYDFMRSARYGRGFAASKFDIASWTSAANYCDTKGWTINMAINQNDGIEDIQDAIKALFRGNLNWWDGKWYLRYADLNFESSVMTLNDEHIVQGDDGIAAIKMSQPGRFNVPDGLRVRFIDADKEYVEDSVIIGDPLGVVEEVTLMGQTNREKAGQIGTYMLERWILDRGISLQARDDALQLEPHDVVTLNTTALSISSQLMRVVEANIQRDGLINLRLIYEDLTLYNDDFDIDTEGIYTVSLPDVNQEPPSVGNVVVTEETYDYRLRTFTRLKITFDEPTGYAFYHHVEVFLSFDDTTYKHLFNAEDDFNIDPVEEGQIYWIRIKVVSIHGVKQVDANDYKISRTIQGHTDEPSSLLGLDAIVNQNMVNLYSVKVTDPDVEIYEFRLGASWSGAVFLGAFRSPNLPLPGTKPGDHTFWANTLGNNGQYGLTPRTASVSLKDPPDGWTVSTTRTGDYGASGDDHQNTEQFTYLGDPVLKCSHGSAGLVGTYLSEVFDLGSSVRYLVYIVAPVIVVGVGTTWDDVIPDDSLVATTWGDINIGSRSWVDIFELVAGPSVQMTILYGDTNPPTNRMERMEILSGIVTARYYQVEIIITDPSDAIFAYVQEFAMKFCQ